MVAESIVNLQGHAYLGVAGVAPRPKPVMFMTASHHREPVACAA